jgi:filamentous hemagglutinin family protein
MAASIDSRLALWISQGSLVVGLALVLAALPLPAQAQITPDATLGDEASRMTPETLVEGDLADLIEGGAIRGGNLFHSFLEFNVDLGQRVYFANPVGIESILSRVTGGDPSSIFGTLGVDGAADLFLINPNGIVFGENASLDIQGSFYATTAEAIPMGEGVYSATAPEQSSLLTVDPSALFSSYLSDVPGNIENRGQLAAGENLTLVGNNLDLQGQVAAGGDLTLLGNVVQIRDTVAVPFVGFAGGDLLVQGNEQVDIVALSHPDSGLYAYGDMVLRSANPVGGDAHYWSGGSFRVENLDTELGDLFSPIDPIIRALGDVEINGYFGTSLHILAGGSVNIGTAIITAPDPGAIGVDFLQETITLSDGTTRLDIDGSAQPTLDVRAGVAPEALGLIPLENPSGFNPATDIFFNEQLQPTVPEILAAPSSADITVGDVVMAAPNGLVLLTNQYQPNANLAGGNILVTGEGSRILVPGDERGINARGQGGQGGAVYLDARNDVSIDNSLIATSGAGTVGDIVINAGDTVRFERQDRRAGAVSALVTGTTGTAGDIRIRATHVELINGAALAVTTFGNGDAGNVVIEARDRVIFDGSDAFSAVADVATGAGGNIEITANSLEVTNGGLLSASTFGNGYAGNVVISTGSLNVFNGATLQASTFGNGDAGNVEIEVRDRVVFDNGDAFSTVEVEATGAGGNVEISTGSLDVLNGAQLQASTFGNGDAGNVVIEARDRAVFDGTSVNGQFSSAALSQVAAGATGAGGNVEIAANSLTVTNGAQLSASTSSRGDAGNVEITVRDHVIFDGRSTDDQISSAALSLVEAGAEGAGGNVVIVANSLAVTNGAQLAVSTRGTGNAGNVAIQTGDRVVFDGTSADGRLSSGALSNVGTGAEGAGGNVEISTGSLDVLNGAQLIASTSGNGDAGNVVIEARDRVVFDGTSADGRLSSGALSNVVVGARGAGGNIEITANSLDVSHGAQLLANTRGNGDAGNVVITAQDYVVFDGRSANGQIGSNALSTVEVEASGAGGNVEISTNSLAVTNGAQLQASTRGAGNAGNVVIMARDFVVFDGSSPDGRFVSAAFSTVEKGATGTGGNVEIIANSLVVTNEAQLAAGTRGIGDAGNVVINAQDRIVFNNGNAFSTVESGGAGAGGNVEIATNILDIINGAQLIASTSGNGDAGEVMIEARDRVNLQGADVLSGRSSAILTNNNGSSDRSQSNDIRITAPQLLIQDGATLFASTVNDQSGGNIVLDLGSLAVLNGGQVVTGSLGSGSAGTIRLDATGGIVISGSDPTFAARAAQNSGVALFAIPQSRLSVRSEAGGAAGNIIIGELGTTPRLELNDGGQITAESASVDGGNIVINLNDLLLLRNGSQISTTAGTAQAGGNGGNITITVPFIVAIPAENSDIAADAFEGAGGNVTITARGIFGIEPRSERTPLSDITASSELGFSGVVTLNTLDTSAIENSLTDLTDVVIDTAALTTGSCIARTDESLGSFTVTGSGGLPQRPGDSAISAYPTGTVQTLATATHTLLEPDGVYQLPDGRLVLSRACE